MRNLHSFPTRRSSDLADDLRATGKAKVIVGLTIVQGPQESEADYGKRIVAATAEVSKGLSEPDFKLKTTFTIFGDRKSTRLNSSHRCISYAVFCLKKK